MDKTYSQPKMKSNPCSNWAIITKNATKLTAHTIQKEKLRKNKVRSHNNLQRIQKTHVRYTGINLKAKSVFIQYFHKALEVTKIYQERRRVKNDQI